MGKRTALVKLKLKSGQKWGGGDDVSIMIFNWDFSVFNDSHLFCLSIKVVVFPI
jgi:hypothetical protein